MTRMDVQIKHPFSMLVSGGRGVGKTVFTTNPLQYRNEMIDKPIQRIVWCYAKHQLELYKKLMNISQHIEYVQGIPTDIDNMFNKDMVNLLILDDLMDEASNDKRISQLFTRGRHDNLSVIYLTQNLFHTKQRSMNLNSDYMVVFKNPRDQSQIQNLARQIYPGNSKFITWAFGDATKDAHSRHEATNRRPI